MDPLQFSVKKHSNRLIINSLSPDGIKLNGQIKTGDYQFNIADFPLQIVSSRLDSVASFNVFLKNDDKRLNLSVDDLSLPSLFGFDLDSINTVFVFKENRVIVPTFNVGLRNAQELVFNIEYDTEYSILNFNTIGIKLGETSPLDQYIYQADIHGHINKTK